MLPGLAMALSVKAQAVGGSAVHLTLDEALAALDMLAPPRPP